MKLILAIILVGINVQMSFGQACGVYKLKYIGEIHENNNLVLTKIKLPTTAFLHGLEKEESERSFQIYELKNKKIDYLMYSHLSCHVTSTADWLFEFYKTNIEDIPIILIGVSTENKEVEIKINISFDQITYETSKKNEDPKITINLGRIVI